MSLQRKGMYFNLVENIHKNRHNGQLNTAAMSRMAAAMPFLEEFPILIHWESFARNPHPTAVEWVDKKAEELSRSFFHREDIYNQSFWNAVSTNPEAINTLVLYPERMSLRHVAKNPRSMHPPLFRLWGHRAREDLFDWSAWCMNVRPCRDGVDDTADAAEQRLWNFLEEHLDCIDWTQLSSNPHTILFLLERHPENIDWMTLAENPHDLALDRLEQEANRPSETMGGDTMMPMMPWFRHLCANTNPRAIALLVHHHPDPTSPLWNWHALSANSSEAAVSLLLQHPEYIHWDMLCTNPNHEALSLLDAHPERVSWAFLSSNPSEAWWSCAAGEAFFLLK